VKLQATETTYFICLHMKCDPLGPFSGALSERTAYADLVSCVCAECRIKERYPDGPPEEEDVPF